MSEYQYYEFQALDRPLDAKARAALRNITSRAEITATSLINEYHFGDFKGSPTKLMEQYFDAFFYYSNWGSRTLMLRVPLAALPLAEAEPYCVTDEDGFSARATREHLILSWDSHNDGGDGYYDDEESSSLASILAVREELMRGDRRPLYLGFLLSVQQGALDDEDLLEPPVPPGLKSLSGAQQALAGFLEIDDDLIAAAAERSADLGKAADPDEERDQAAWVKALPADEKDAYLLQLLRGESAHLGVELRRRFRDDRLSKRREEERPAAEGAGERRSSAALLARASEFEEERRQRQKLKKQREAEEAERRRVAAREKHLATLAGKEAGLWLNVESFVSTKKPGQYDEAVKVIQDLRELARRAGTLPAFAAQLTVLREKHAAKRTFLERLDRAGLS